MYDDPAILLDCNAPNVDAIMLRERRCRSSADYVLLSGYSHFNMNKSDRKCGGVDSFVKVGEIVRC